jgi:hypothetical protein
MRQPLSIKLVQLLACCCQPAGHPGRWRQVAHLGQAPQHTPQLAGLQAAAAAAVNSIQSIKQQLVSQGAGCILEICCLSISWPTPATGRRNTLGHSTGCKPPSSPAFKSRPMQYTECAYT